MLLRLLLLLGPLNCAVNIGHLNQEKRKCTHQDRRHRANLKTWLFNYRISHGYCPSEMNVRFCCKATLKGPLRIQWYLQQCMLTEGKVNFIAFQTLKCKPKKTTIKIEIYRPISTQVAILLHNCVNPLQLPFTCTLVHPRLLTHVKMQIVKITSYEPAYF